MYDKSAIMKAAWAIVRKANVARFGLRTILSNALRTAWRNAKAALDTVAPLTPEAEAILIIESRSDRLNREDRAQVEALRHRGRAA